MTSRIPAGAVPAIDIAKVRNEVLIELTRL
ncbi:hypothetical protein ShzoTeo12_53610 (plasmid) [Shinella zoogloeoides]|nr:hypothetical protein ShzoTeo12_53610 [Shinella zoogloeoides]